MGCGCRGIRLGDGSGGSSAGVAGPAQQHVGEGSASPGAGFVQQHARCVLGAVGQAHHAATAIGTATGSRLAVARARSGGGLTLLPTIRTAALVVSGVPLAVRSMM